MRFLWTVFAAIVLFPQTIFSYEPDSNRFVVVAEPLVRVVSNDGQLREWCGVGGRIEACTRFIAFRIDAVCSPAPDHWTMRAAATFRPWIFLRNLAQLTHEHEHIGDLVRFAAAHAAALEALSFPSGEECRQRSIQEAARFGETMREWARQSNDARHPSHAETRRARRSQ